MPEFLNAGGAKCTPQSTMQQHINNNNTFTGNFTTSCIFSLFLRLHASSKLFNSYVIITTCRLKYGLRRMGLHIPVDTMLCIEGNYKTYLVK